MTDLIQRLTDATGNERGLFEEAFWLLFPEVDGGPEWHPSNGKLRAVSSTPEWDSWAKFRLRFLNMLDAEAWTSAADMFCPEDRSISVEGPVERYEGDMVVGIGFRAAFYLEGSMRCIDDATEAFAHTEANARTIAALKAHGGNDAE